MCECSIVFFLICLITPFCFGMKTNFSTILDSITINQGLGDKISDDMLRENFSHHSNNYFLETHRVDRSHTPMNLRASVEDNLLFPFFDCPEIFCFTFRNNSKRWIELTCQAKPPDYGKFMKRISCKYRKHSTIQDVSVRKIHEHQLGDKGHGYDLKIWLAPSIHEIGNSPSDQVSADVLSPNVLKWLISKLRGHLKMKLSPIHLTLSGINVESFRRADLGDLSSNLHVTRLTIQNPKTWEEDSLMPISIKSPTRLNVFTLLPPFFRLTIHCERHRRATKFRRLWIPWPSWQIRFIDCPMVSLDCRAWISKYPICSDREHFMPTYFILPRRTDDLTGNQLLFSESCDQETRMWDPVDDLQLKLEEKCWQPDSYGVTERHDTSGPVLFINPSLEIARKPVYQHSNSSHVSSNSLFHSAKYLETGNLDKMSISQNILSSINVENDNYSEESSNVSARIFRSKTTGYFQSHSVMAYVFYALVLIASFVVTVVIVLSMVYLSLRYCRNGPRGQQRSTKSVADCTQEIKPLNSSLFVQTSPITNQYRITDDTYRSELQIVLNGSPLVVRNPSATEPHLPNRPLPPPYEQRQEPFNSTFFNKEKLGPSSLKSRENGCGHSFRNGLHTNGHHSKLNSTKKVKHIKNSSSNSTKHSRVNREKKRLWKWKHTLVFESGALSENPWLQNLKCVSASQDPHWKARRVQSSR